MTRSGAVVWGIAALLICTCLAVLQRNSDLNVDSNILSLLPATESDPAINAAFENFSEINMRRLVFLVEHTDLSQAKQNAEELVESLRESPWVEDMTLRVSADEQAAIGSFNYTYRYHLLTRADAQLLASGDHEVIAEDAVARIYSPLTGALAALVPTDPFLLSYRFGSASGAAIGGQSLAMDDGYLTGSRDGRHYVLLTGRLTQSPFDPGLQQDVLARIDTVESSWKQSSSPSRLIRTGALFYTADAYETASGEISLFGGASLLLVLSLMLIAFRSLKPALLVVLVLAFGIGAGFITVRLVFGQVHVMTFIFGASLIGVAVDYAFHYFVATPGSEPGGRLRTILPAITLGLLSSVIGYLALLSTPFPGLQQMALFSMVGLTGAWLTVVLLFPTLRIETASSPTLLRLCSGFIGFGATSAARRVWLVALVLPLVAIGILMTAEEPHDDLRQFQALNPALEEQEEEIQAVLESAAANQFYLVRGDSPENVLQRMEAAAGTLDIFVRDGLIDGYVGLSPWLESVERQQEHYALYRTLFQSDAVATLIDAGLLTEAEFASARTEFLADESNYLLPRTWLDSSLGRQLSYLWIGAIEDSYFAIIALRGVHAEESLSDINADVVYVDQVATINDLLLTYRQSAAVLLLVAAGLILALLSLRYGIVRAAVLLSAPLIALSMTVVVFALIGETLNLFNVLALFLVVGVGIDFGIFCAEARQPNPRTLLAVMLSALTTIFSFGMLSLSSTSVIQSFGLTMLIGITTLLVLTPVIGHLVTASTTTATEDSPHV